MTEDNTQSAHIDAEGLEQLVSSVFSGAPESPWWLADLPRYMDSAHRLDPTTVSRAAALGLRALADTLESETSSRPGARLDAFVQRCERELGPLLESRAQPTRRDDAYGDSVIRTIADALRAAGISPLNSGEHRSASA